MCEQGDIKLIQRRPRSDEVIEVDKCITPIVWGLNRVGVETVASCCGHGKQPGTIALRDGRELRIMTYDQARKVDKLFEPINPDEGDIQSVDHLKNDIADILSGFVTGIQDPFKTAEEILDMILVDVVRRTS